MDIDVMARKVQELLDFKKKHEPMLDRAYADFAKEQEKESEEKPEAPPTRQGEGGGSS
jgi:hypothetical protein